MNRTQIAPAAASPASAGPAASVIAGAGASHAAASAASVGAVSVTAGAGLAAASAASLGAASAGALSASTAGVSTGSAAIRRARSGDRDAIRDFLVGLSLRSRHLRFFTGAAPSSAAMLRILAGGGDNIDVVVAARGDGAIVGHAMAVDATKPGGACTTEIGVVVADAWQGRGIGSALVRTLTARARARGATAVVMEVLAENRQVLAMIARRWPDAQHQRSAAWVTISANCRTNDHRRSRACPRCPDMR